MVDVYSDECILVYKTIDRGGGPIPICEWVRPCLILGGDYRGVDPSCNKTYYSLPLLDGTLVCRWDEQGSHELGTDWLVGQVVNGVVDWSRSTALTAQYFG